MNDDVYQLYVEELALIKPCDQAETDQLLVAVAAGSKDAKQRLTEGYLQAVLDLTTSYQTDQILLSDFIQEANLVLTCVINDCQQRGCQLDYQSFWNQVKGEVDTVFTDMLDKQQQLMKQQEEMVAKVNVMEIVAQRLAKDLGRQATLAELAEKMQLSQDEATEILSWTLDALNVGEI